MVRLSSIGKMFTTLRGWMLLFICYDGAFWLLLLLHPIDYSGIVVIDDALQWIGPVLVATLCLWYAQQQRSLSLLLIGLGILAFALGRGIWAFEELILRVSPFPSIADIAFILSYSLLLIGLLCIPRHQMNHIKQLQVILDMLLMMTVIVTISWYFVLGPTLRLPEQSLLAKVVGTSYPCFDLGLLLCLLILRGSRKVDLGLLLLSIGLIIVMVVDSLFDYLNIRYLYATGNIIDPLWCVGYQCIGLGIIVQQKVSYSLQSLPVHILYARMCFAFLLALSLLILYMRFMPKDDFLQSEVYIGVALTVSLMLIRLFVVRKDLKRIFA